MSDSNEPQMSEFFMDALVWDAHAGVFPSTEVDLSLLRDWHESGANYISINVGFDVMDWQQTLATLAAYRRWMQLGHERYCLVSSVDDIRDAKQKGKLAVSFDIEGMNALNGDINMISAYHTLGVRQMLFAYNLNNPAAGGCHDNDMGLTQFGKDIVHEMNRVGMIVDCSHAAYLTTMDIMTESSKPVVFSHSNPNQICNHQRNILDDQIRACAQTGGVIGVNGMGIFLGENDVSQEVLIKHISYLAELVGPEYIGFGLDYSPKVDIDIGEILRSRPDFWPAGQRYNTKGIKHVSPAQLPDLSEKLLDHGFSQNEVRGILGENFCRVAAVSWAV